MTIVGIDPGASGALAVIRGKDVDFVDFKDNEIYVYSKLLKDLKEKDDDLYVFVEKT
jgi:predicted RNase H-like nuclease (RuvC/YqgF family)